MKSYPINRQGYLKSRYRYKSFAKRLLAAGFDFLGEILVSPRRLFRMAHSKPPRKILLIRNDQLGDLIMALPAALALKERYPDAEIDLWVDRAFRELLAPQRDFHEILAAEKSWFAPDAPKGLKSWRLLRQVCRLLAEKGYDLAVDFRGDLRNILAMAGARIPRRIGYGGTGGKFLLTDPFPYRFDRHQVDLNLELVRALGAGRPVRAQGFAYSAERCAAFWNDLKIKFPMLSAQCPKILVHASANFPSKRWPEAKFRRLIDLIAGEKLGVVVLLGTAEDKKILPGLGGGNDGVVDLRGLTRLADLPLLMSGCDLFVGNDSGPAHLAAFQGMKVVSIFSGTNDPALWRPWTERLWTIRHAVPCSPCEERVCPLGHHDCMEKIEAGQVYDTVRRALADKAVHA